MIIENYWDGKNWLRVFKDDYLIVYHLNKKLHREDGPAEILCFKNDDNILYYYFNGLQFDPEDLPFELPIDSGEKRLYINLKYGEENV